MLVEYCVISGINVVLMLAGAFIVIVSKHMLAQWRLNKPTPVVEKQGSGASSSQNSNANLDIVVSKSGKP